MLLKCALLTALAAQTQGPPPTIVTAPFPVLDNVEGSWVNLNHVPIRPMAIDAGNVFYVVNTHDSTVEHFLAGNSAPAHVWGVPWNPVSIALWSGNTLGGDGPDELLVACRGDYCLVRLDKATGRVKGLVELPAEPGDLLIDEATDRAFVSCSGVDAVVQIDLTQPWVPGFNPIERTYSARTGYNFDCKHPLFMSWSADGKILVAPLASGNNTTTEPRGSFRGAGFKVFALGATTGLPDQDLFLIDPAANTTEPVVKGSGSILFGHGVHPLTGQHWQLNTESLNAHIPPSQVRLSEADHKGIFSVNRVTRTTPAAGSIQTAAIFDNLDTFGGGTVDPTRAVGQPYAITFHSDGRVFVSGLLTDNVVILDAGGNYLQKIDLPAGSIPRGLAIGTVSDVVFVYCWGTNQVRAYNATTLALRKVFNLNYDPTPAQVKTGRAIYYDGDNSLNQNMSCATCHIEGRTDMLMWTLSDLTADDKGPMMTQTLAGIEKMTPFHWRGERPRLKDFNGAFEGLLGGTKLTNQEFADFQAFVFSIQNPANPFESPLREIDSSIQAPMAAGGNAVNGLQIYNQPGTALGSSCNECHMLPTGTGNDTSAVDFPETIPRRTRLKVAPFHELWRREQKRVTVTLPTGVTQERPLLGAGISHSGRVADLKRFMEGGFNFTNQEENDVSAFVHQIDQGIAPAAHRAFFLDAASAATVGATISSYLEPQSTARNCDIAVVSTTIATGVAARWAYDRVTGKYLPESGGASRLLTDFVTAASAGTESAWVVGLPVGMAERWGIDFDADGIVNGAEAVGAVYTPAAATAAPALAGGVITQWVSSRVSRVAFETTIPVRATVRYWPTSIGPSAAKLAAPTEFSRVHAPLLTELIPSTAAANTFVPAQPTFDYTLELILEPHGAAPTTVPGPVNLFASAPFIFTTLMGNQNAFGTANVVKELSLSQQPDGAGNTEFTVTIGTSFKQGGPPVQPALSRVVVGTVYVDGVRDSAFTALASANSYQVGGVTVQGGGNTFTFDASLGTSFLTGFETTATVPPSSVGETTFKFKYLTAAVSGKKVSFNVEAIFPVVDTAAFHAALAGSTPTGNLTIAVVGARQALADWSMVDTEKNDDIPTDFRMVTVQVP